MDQEYPRISTDGGIAARDDFKLNVRWANNGPRFNYGPLKSPSQSSASYTK